MGPDGSLLPPLPGKRLRQRRQTHLLGLLAIKETRAMFGASSGNCGRRGIRDWLSFSAAAIIRRYLNARASAFTNVVSVAEKPRCAVPPGVSISFRPPHGFRTASGTRTVSIYAAPVMAPSLPIRRWSPPAPPTLAGCG